MELKAYIEKRNAKLTEMNTLKEKVVKELRAFTEEEDKQFKDLEKEIRGMDEIIENMKKSIVDMPIEIPKSETIEEQEIRAFAQTIREHRAGEQNFTQSGSTPIVPSTIANKIIKAVKDISPVYARATIYNVMGTLKVPVYGKANTTHDITVGYQGAEFTELTADAGKFTSVDLTGYAVGALSLVSQQLLTNGDIDLVNFVVQEMSEKIAEWLEGQLLKGTGSSACQGITVGCTNTLTAASATAITADELITLQAKVKQAYQKNACFIMAPDTFTALRKLKDSNGRYLLQDDITGEFPYRLLGKPVFLSDNMATIEASAKTIIYGDMSGLSVKIARNINIQVLREKYATQNAIGVVGWLEVDSKVTDNQRLAVLVQAA
ncbi:MAG TPA: phage major capsid protein [Flavobacteriaceae bacterium]|nr:phage major capsid protein [Flavobacteriaceae bacterium]